MLKLRWKGLAPALVCLLSLQAGEILGQTDEPAQTSGDDPAATGEFSTTPILTIGEGDVGNSFNQQKYGYEPPGIPDGMGAYLKNFLTVRVFLNHELPASAGYAYQIGGGPSVTGARISYIDINRFTRQVVGVGPAFDTVYDRQGALVTSAAQINESGNATNGFERLCSANLFTRGSYGLADTIFLTNEETSADFGHAHGGSYWALDVNSGELWALPDFGRGVWESATFVRPPTGNTVAAILGDDSGGAPLYLYVGRKDRRGGFLERNGLAGGQLYVWVANDGSIDPSEFNGTGSSKSGTFVPIDARDITMAGEPGYDDDGYKDDTTLRSEAQAMGAFQFSRPEDVQVNPNNPNQVAFASTGREQLFGGADSWGTTYVVDLRLRGANLAATLKIVCDGDDNPDNIIRSPDNLTWANDGYIYVQEDRSVSGFGESSGVEASMWKLNPNTLAIERVTVIDRSAVPANQVDTDPDDLGDWESSGVVDVSDLFLTLPWETLVLMDVQAHAIREGGLIDGPLSGGRNGNLVEGGQVLFASNGDSFRGFLQWLFDGWFF